MVVTFSWRYGADGENMQRRARACCAPCRIGTGFGDRDLTRIGFQFICQDAGRRPARHNDVVGALEGVAFACLQFDLAGVRQTRFEKQRVMNDGDQAAAVAWQTRCWERAKGQSVNKERCGLRRCGNEPVGVLDVFGRRVWKGSGEFEMLNVHSEVRQQLDHAPVIGVTACGASQVAGDRKNCFSH